MMRYFLAMIAFLGFWISLFVHGSTCAGLNLEISFAAVMLPLHIFCLGLFFPVVINWHRERKNKRDFRKWLFSSVPLRFRGMVRIFEFYAVLNFLLCLCLLFSSGPTPVEEDGKYGYREADGSFIEISQTEFYREMGPTLRLFSGHWMYFYLVALLYYGFHKSEKRKNDLFEFAT